jgi:hypothetical protein
MANADRDIASPVSALKYVIKYGSLAVFQKTPQPIRAQIGDLNHAGKLAINEQRRFNYALNICPKRTRPMK